MGIPKKVWFTTLWSPIRSLPRRTSLGRLRVKAKILRARVSVAFVVDWVCLLMVVHVVCVVTGTHLPGKAHCLMMTMCRFKCWPDKTL